MSKPVKKKLLCFIIGPSLFESAFPILERLSERGHVEVEVIVATRLRKKSPEVISALVASGLKVRYKSRFWIEYASMFSILGAGAIISDRDPYAYPKRGSLRDMVLPKSRASLIFIQHGMLQSGVNSEYGGMGLKWCSDLLLWWDGYSAEESGFLPDGMVAKVKKIGFIKKFFQSEARYNTEDLQLWRSYRQRLLICTNFSDQRIRFGEGRQAEFYEMIDAFCARNPDVLIILRPHRARRHNRQGHDDDRAFDAELIQRCKNVVVMDSQNEVFAQSTIFDGFQICDAVISHASTVVLDSMYSGLPTGVLDNKLPKLASLPNITNLAELEAFSQAAAGVDPHDNEVFRTYGEMEDNIARAARIVEDHMLGPKGYS